MMRHEAHNPQVSRLTLAPQGANSYHLSACPNLGLGSYPIVRLAAARRKALENRRAVEQGRNPRAGWVPTFADAAERVIAIHARSWKNSGRSAEIWRSSLDTYAYPKIGDEHRVALSDRALAILEAARSLADRSGLIFPSTTGRQLSNNTMRKLLIDLDIPAVPHGFRASFRSWCADTDIPREVAEAALGHVVAGVEGAYQRSDLLDKRRPVMDQWATYIETAAA